MWEESGRVGDAKGKEDTSASSWPGLEKLGASWTELYLYQPILGERKFKI